MVYKPGSVQELLPCMTIHLGCLLPNTSSDQPEEAEPTQLCCKQHIPSYSVLLPVGFALPSMLP